jgi:hypothetical protein
VLAPAAQATLRFEAPFERVARQLFLHLGSFRLHTVTVPRFNFPVGCRLANAFRFRP